MASQDEAYTWWVGIDWAAQAHKVVIVDEHGRPEAERSVAHTGGAIGEFIEWLVHLADGRPERVGVGIEIPRGAIVDTLVERGFHVWG